MIASKKLCQELKEQGLEEGLEIHDLKDLFDTIEALWRVAEAAKNVAWFVESLDDDIDPNDESQTEYIIEKKEFFDALSALAPEGK